MVLVSVVMLSYNQDMFLPESIESVLNQTFTDFELLIIDDCSQDSSKEIIDKYMRRDKRIRAFFHEKNMGIAKTVNQGFLEAKGKFVALIASDDIWVETKLEKQLSILSDDDSLVVWSEGNIVDKEGTVVAKSFTEMHFSQNRKKSGYLFEELLHGNFILGSSLILRRDYLKKIRFSEELEYYSDFKFFIDLSRAYSFYYIPEPLVKYRIHGRNTIFTDKLGWERDKVIFVTYLLREFDADINYKIKADLLRMVGYAYSYLGDKTAARKAFLAAMSHNPFSMTAFESLISALRNGEDKIAKFFTRIVFFFSQ
ncbi:MAG: glycosyltransferase, partial [Promethearchaeota archaeon]